jgi:xanthine/CO dehydrogenase XdhC/CoxF family maturation factor
VRLAWWLTEAGPIVERYSTVPDDGEMPYGSGCGGVVYILLERRATAGPFLTALESAFQARVPLAIAAIIEGSHMGQRAYAGLSEGFADSENKHSRIGDRELNDLAQLAYAAKQPMTQSIQIGQTETRAWADYRPARPGLWIFGAGDDAKPLVHLARSLGWFVAVIDGRSHLATRIRFPEADLVSALDVADPSVAKVNFDLRPTDAAVVMTHSFEQDLHILSSLLGERAELPLAYLGVLGPQRRTLDMLAEAARLQHLADPEDRAEQWLTQLHAPTGLDLGAETPATVALSILSEIQQTLAAATAQPLKKVRAATPGVTC